MYHVSAQKSNSYYMDMPKRIYILSRDCTGRLVMAQFASQSISWSFFGLKTAHLLGPFICSLIQTNSLIITRGRKIMKFVCGRFQKLVSDLFSGPGQN